MLVLGIESTCDETAASIVESGEKILSNIIYSQSDLHKKYGGVFPELASRKHVDVITNVIDEAILQAQVKKENIDLIAAANGPGLIGALLVGVNAAKALSYAWNIPLVGVNHVEAHIYAAMMGQQKIFPSLGVVLSGGHTFLILMHDLKSYTLIGTTQDDAIGEAFDKTASILNLPYPGGPEIEKLAAGADENKYLFKTPFLKDRPFDLSFSGIKTKVLYTVKGQGKSKKDPDQIDGEDKKHLAASFQKIAFDSVIQKMEKAVKTHSLQAVYLGGGVTQNNTLRKMVHAKFLNFPVFWPASALSLDNAAMIAGLGFHNFQNQKLTTLSDLDVKMRIPLEDLSKN
ncbi:MAG: tRNA (adenosine(37)-N6)-threonylcarbamoyltransferase complex transferase subunit TsaD [Chlamydiae bacterium CG10_big_fil_rev_8_21_14_0_10_35_9]|nr:MAG: tRNA (adenosine(37)-N6)-threonylcarbamoyltransferase complex transferase subunit TsaD [Chlamydiae bacterium CG10_big_fil_rev_8_21_14_0_10_35_9]